MLRAVESAGGTAALGSSKYGDAVSTIFGAVCKARPSSMHALYTVISPYVKGNFVPQRVVAILVIGMVVFV